MTQTYDTVTITQNPIQIANADTGDVLLSNLDFNNSVYLSYEQAVNTSSAASAGVIPPTGSLEITPKQTVYAACQTGKTASLQFIPDGSGFTPSATQIAQQILNSGTILVDNPVILSSQLVFPGQTWGSGVTTGTPVLDVRTFQSWQFNWTPSGNVAGSKPYFQCVINFYTDAAGTNLIWQETWYLPSNLSINGTTLAWSQIYGHGPMRGAYMSFSFTNLDSITQSAEYSISGSSRSMSVSTMRSDNANNSGGVGTDDVLAFLANNSVAAGTSTAEQPINYYNGRVIIRLRATGTNVAADTIFFHLKTQPVQDFASVDNTALSFPVRAPGANSPDTLYEFYLPKRPCTFTIQNTGAVSASVRVLVTADGGKP